jgi:hypothetical protein
MPLEAEQVCPITHTGWVRLSEHCVVVTVSLINLKRRSIFMKRAALPASWKSTVEFVANAGLGNWDVGFIDRDWAKPDSE